VSLTTITVTGSYPPGAGTGLATGWVEFTPTARIVNATGHTIIPQTPITVQLQVGAVSLPGLVTTDNAGLLPTGWAWQVTEHINDTSPVTYTVNIPSSYGATVDLAQLSPVTPAPTSASFVQLGGDIGGTSTVPLVAKIQGTTIQAPPGGESKFLAGDGTWQTVSSTPAYQFPVGNYGAKGDGQVVHDGAMSSVTNPTVLACTTSLPFKLADVGKHVIVRNAGPSGVSALVTTITGFTDSGHVTLAASASTTVSSTLVFWATDDTAAIQSALNAAVAYAEAGSSGRGVAVGAPGMYGVFGPLVTGGSTLGNAQLTLPVPATTVNKVYAGLECLDPAASGVGAHWQQLTFQNAGMTLVSGGVFASQSAQATSISAAGNPCVIGGPTQPNHYGDSNLVFSNMCFSLRGVTIATPLSASGWNYCGADFSGLSQAVVRDVTVTVTGTYAANDFNSPATFSGGASKGILMPANGNNDLCDVQNLSVWGGYTWAFLATEHTVMRNVRLLYSWSALGLVGYYFNSVGAGHAIYGDQISVEGCVYNWYIFGQGASGIGPFVDIVQMDTESPAPTCRDDGNGGVQFSLGRIKLTGLYTAASISIPQTGVEVIDGQQRPGPVTATVIPTGTTAVANPHWRWANVTLAGGTVTAVKIGTYMGGVSAPSMTTVYSQSAAALPLSTFRVPPGGWIEVDCTVTPTTNAWVLD
jgi:hypothetical protein